ncbi:hypothetical protein A2Y85_08240, partial [candidate division WOR-3 bacterium RBG_13_43_14]
PVASDSLGVRSMATYVETKDVKIFIDPGVAVSPDRYSLPPHHFELDRHREMWQAIKQWVSIADIVIVTHYHYDHHNPDDPTLYDNKDIYLKHPRENINPSQQERATALLALIEQRARSITLTDNHKCEIGNTRIVFSPPVGHGILPKLGYVTEVLVEEDEKFLFSSDVQGPLNNEAMQFIIESSPDILYVDGPATYLLGSHYKKSDINNAIENLSKVILSTNVKTVIIDHHLMRDLNWNEYIDILSKVKPHVRIVTAAGYCGRQEEPLEALRQQLYIGQVV